MSHPAGRVLALLELLQTRHRSTGRRTRRPPRGGRADRAPVRDQACRARHPGRRRPGPPRRLPAALRLQAAAADAHRRRGGGRAARPRRRRTRSGSPRSSRPPPARWRRSAGCSRRRSPTGSPPSRRPGLHPASRRSRSADRRPAPCSRSPSAARHRQRVAWTTAPGGASSRTANSTRTGWSSTPAVGMSPATTTGAGRSAPSDWTGWRGDAAAWRRSTVPDGFEPVALRDPVAGRRAVHARGGGAAGDRPWSPPAAASRPAWPS